MPQPAFDARYFEENYRDYVAQNPPRKMRFYTSLVETYHSSDSPSRIHDIGCGFGLFLQALDERWEIFGSDVSPHAVARAARACPRGAFSVADAIDPPDGYGGFGVLTAFDVIEHVPDLMALVEAIDRQLAPAGLFLFLVPVYDGLSGPIIRLLDRDPTHVHKWPRRRWLDWASSRFELLHWQGVVRYLLPFGYLHVPTRRLRNHAPAICVACRKPR